MRRLISLFVSLALITSVFGQTTIDVGGLTTEMKLKSATETSVQLETRMQSLQFKTMLTDEGEFEGLNLDNLQKDHNISPGAPDLPVYAELIEVPYGAEIVATVIDYDETIYNLNDLGLQKISPAQPSLSKSTDPESVQFQYDAALYSTDSWIEPEIVSTSYQGVMRGVPIGQVVVRPFRYNPATNELSVLSNIKLDISFENADLGLTMDQKSKYYSPQFSGAYNMLLNYQPPTNKDTFTDYPIKYVIVADRAFETTLQPFIEWKTKSGYDVIEAYTDVIGTSTTAIQSYLQGLYDAGNASDPAPTYVLIVGDHDGNYNVPAFAGETGSHVTDVYYGCYDGGGDNIPDLYLGRMSANTTTELQNILDKILPYEMYTIPDGTYLDRCMLIAGVDGTFAPTHGDGTISYGIREYFNEAHGFTDIFAYYYSYTSGDYHVMSSNSAGASNDIKNKISAGVGFANYTAHCMQYGWGDPAVVNDDIAGFNNVDKYAFMIGNCCLSFKFNHADYDAFGEQLLYAENKGAINYIGTSNNSLWDEDVYWGIGLTSLDITQANVTNHNFSNTGQGAYDGVMHEHGESFDEWFFTGGQMVFAANTQVQASTSGNKQYYWEIYHNSGDPSLMPFLTQPEAMTVSYSAPMIGNTSLNVSCEPYTYVAISQNGVLLDAKWSGASNSVTLSFPALTADGASVVATKQDRVPHINDFTPIAPDPPTADFSGTPTTILEGESVTFTDLSTYAVEWDWSFGDGGNSTEANPVYTYNTAGTYTVSLTVTNPIDSDTHTKTDYIIVNPNTNPPASDFVADQTTVTMGTTVNFTDQSANFPTSWEWTFDGGDIASSTDQNPSVVYNTPGTYTVELTASNGYGQGTTETKVDYITVTLPDYCDASQEDENYMYIADFEFNTISNPSGAAGYTDFTNLSTDVIAGDAYTVSVNAGDTYDSNQCIIWVDWNRDGDFEDAEEEIYRSAIGSVVDFTTDITIPAAISNGITRLRVKVHYNQDGYGVNDTPCGTGGYGEVEDYTINVISPDIPPVADFSASPLSTCDGEVSFIDESNFAESWNWDFGDGNTSMSQNPVHTYTSNGTYTVMLTVTNAYGNDSHTEIDYVVVDMPVAPTVTDAENCGPGNMTLTANGSGTLNWYDAPTGGNLITTGTSLNDNFNVTTSYYVESEVAGTTHSAGKLDNSGNGGYFGNVDYVHGLIFDAYTEFTINSVKVYADGAKDRVINLKNESGTIIETRTVAVADGESRIDLNITVPVGTNYTLECDGDADLYRNNDGTSYPYEVADILSIHYNTADDLNYYYFFYDWEISEGSCLSTRTQVTATVHDIPTVDLGANQTICETDDYTFDAGAGFSNYEWSNSSNSQSITVNTADVYSVTVTDANGCEAEGAVELFVDAMPTITIDAVDDLCENESALTLSATPVGGNWSGTGVTGNQFDPSIGNGDHSITYEVTNGECTATENISIHVDAMPDATIDAVGPFCAGDAAVTLTAATAGGTWSGSGVTGDQFDPTTAGIGSHTITYEIDNGACTATDQITIDVSANADATIDAVADLCITDAALTLTATTAGGTWSGDGVTGDTFDPASAGSGDHVITYTISGACGDSDQITIHVDAMPSISITDPGAFCTGDAAVTLSATPVGGTWTGTGISGDQFDPTVAGIGNHTISYEVTNGTCTATEDITLYVSDGYDATIDAISDLCEADDPITLTAADGGGTWSGDGVTGDTFDPDVAGEGDHVVTYTIAGSCGDSDQITIHVDAMPDASINAVGPFCAGDAAITLTAATAGGTWTGDGVTGNQFDPVAAGIGSHVITYEVNNGVCTATDQITIDVNAYADATINAVSDLCEADDPITLTAADGGGIWSGNGVTGDTFDPNVAGEGDHVVTYTIAGSCGDSDQITIHVDEMPDASINAVGPFCAGDAAITLTAATAGGTWSGDGVTGNQFNPAAAGIGTHEITYQVSNGTCTDNDMIEIVVSDYFDASITPVDDMCSSDAAISLNAADAGGTWSGDGVTGDTFDPALAGEGDHVITYTIAGSCGDTDQITIHVDAMPNASITHPGDFCVGDDPVVLTATETGGTWSGDGVVGDTFDPSVAGLGVYTITYTIENGVCTDSDDVTVVVGEEPVVTVDITNASSATAEDGAATLNISDGISPYTILWSTGDETVTVENLAVGTYSVMVTDAAGCSTNVPVLIDFTNSIADESLQIKLYPNPAKTALYIETNPNMVNRVELVNMLGQSIMTENINGTITILDVSKYVSGVYFVRIYALDGEQHINRVVID